MKSHSIEFSVEHEDTDMEGVVFYPRYFTWFDRATNAFLKAVGISSGKLLHEQKFAHPVTECGCHFTHTLHYDNPVRITTTVTEVHEHHFKLHHVIYSGDMLMGSGYEVRIWVKIDEPEHDRRFVVVPIPEEIINKLCFHTNGQHKGVYSEYEEVAN